VDRQAFERRRHETGQHPRAAQDRQHVDGTSTESSIARSRSAVNVSVPVGPARNRPPQAGVGVVADSAGTKASHRQQHIGPLVWVVDRRCEDSIRADDA
jgi:hypothetical protein